MSTDEDQFRRVEWDGDEPHESDDDGPDGMPLRPPSAGLSAEDLELLTLAARALGATVEPVDGEWWVNLHFADGQVVYGWNPLMISGDALELSVRLQLTVWNEHVSAGAAYCTSGDPAEGPFTVFASVTSGANESEVIPDDFAATRRAIVLAAAEIGKGMA